MACTQGDQKCIGDDLYECRGHFDLTLHQVVYEWELIERDAPQCVVEPEPEPEPEPTPEELIYANWLRTGGTGSISYWRSIGSPLYYTPPEPTPEELIYQNWLRTGGTGSFAYWVSIGSPLYYTPEPTPTDEELIYQNWLRTGGIGSIEYWRSIGSPLYYTPEPEPEPEYKGTIVSKELEYDNTKISI